MSILGLCTEMKLSEATALVEAAGRNERKLDLGCGLNPKEGFEGVDLYGDKAKHKVDLFKFPWPFADDSVDEIHCSHFLEHVPAREVEVRDLVFLPDDEDHLGQDMLFAFMDECYRILKPEGWMHIIVPSGRSNRAFWDPTHRRFFMQETFLYFNADWRKLNGLQHYRVHTNFGVDVGHTLPQEEALRSQDAQTARFQTLWNVTADWIAKLKKLPMPPEEATNGSK
jgi:SAM-dependent methyltransferase